MIFSYFICLLWFYHELLKGEIVTTYVDIVRDICYICIGESFDKTHFTCNWLDLGWVYYFEEQEIKFSIEAMQICPRNK